jgi:hypothetical protein
LKRATLNGKNLSGIRHFVRNNEDIWAIFAELHIKQARQIGRGTPKISLIAKSADLLGEGQ